MKRSKWLLLALSALLLAGCSLARAEDGGGTTQGDRWVGFYVMRETGRERFYNNPNLTEYGSQTLETKEYGNFQIPKQVLLAVEEDNGYRFPGMEGGYSLFRLRREEDFGPVTEMISNMGPGDLASSIHVSDTGSEEVLSGAVYEGPPAGVEDWDPYENRRVLTAYRVFQTPSGEVYLDGSGNSYTTGGGSFTETRTYTYSEDGETVKEDKLTVKVLMETVPRLEKVTVIQYDADNEVVRSDELSLEENLPELVCEGNTAWVLVEEINSDGAVHTAYDIHAEEEPVRHTLVLLDGEGLGTAAELSLIPAA